jgi:[ribosomal protein S5]-alanine N-acetyltransferase
MTLEQPLVSIIPCNVALLEVTLQDRNRLATMLGVSLPAEWPQFPEAMEYACQLLKAYPALNEAWWCYLFVEPDDRVLVGSGGFKGAPDCTGMVEIGYEIAAGYRNRGYATAAARAMLDFAFSNPQVAMVDAHTLPEPNPSSRVLEKARMRRLGTVYDPADGVVWHWRISRAEYEAPEKIGDAT